MPKPLPPVLAVLPLCLTLCLGLAGCGGEDPGEGSEPGGDTTTAAGRDVGDPALALDTDCPTVLDDTRVLDNDNLRGVALVEDRAVYATGDTVVIDPAAGAAGEPVVLAETDPGLEVDGTQEPLVLGSVDGDVLLAVPTGDDQHAVRRTTVDGEVVWEAEASGPSDPDLAYPAPAVLVRNADGQQDYVDAADGRPVEFTDPRRDLGMLVLTIDGLDLLLGDVSSQRLAYSNSLDAPFYVTEPGGAAPVEVPAVSSVQVCGDLAYALDLDAGELGVYDLAGGEPDEIRTVELPEPVTQTLFEVSDGAVVLDVAGGSLVLSDS